MRLSISIFLIVSFSLCHLLFSQQITQNFTFLTSDVQINQSGVFDVISLPDTFFIEEEGLAGIPQLPVKQFKIILPKGASITSVNLNINSEELFG